MPVKLYFLLASPPARAVQVTLKTLNIPHEVINVNLANGEHKSENFLKLNPQHTVPVILEEDGFTVSDSHAINAYLVSKYAKDDKLYPKDLKVRSIVDHRLYFDCGVLFQVMRSIAYAYFIEKSITGLTPTLLSRFTDAYDTLERFLASSQYIAADHITIADYSVLTTLGNTQVFVPVDKEKYPKLAAYIQRGYANIPSLEEANKAAVGPLKEFFEGFSFLKGFIEFVPVFTISNYAFKIRNIST